ncbi:MAG: tetratricopeptide repeat protein [Gammaproteobacteria bacterium]|nr:tetratricopeptide repeat protein [Gammaproteobacteria bacterium]
MSNWLRCLALVISAGAAVPVFAASRCAPGAAFDIAMRAERALFRADWPSSARLYACALARSDDVSLAERATRTAYDNFQLADAVADSRRWLELAPDSEIARRYLATGLLRLYDDVGAAEQFAALLDSSYQDRARGYVTLLGILAEERNDTGAARVMERLAAADPGLPEAQYALSVLWQRAEDGNRALAAARRAIELRPEWPMAELAEVRALSLIGRRAEAIEKSAALAAGDDAFSRLSHAWLLLGNKRRAEATAIFEELRRSGVAASEAQEGLGAIALDERRFDDATRIFNELASDPQNSDTVLWHLGRIAEQTGDKAFAARHFQRIGSGSRAVAAQTRAFRLSRELGAPERAELQLDEFLAAVPAFTRDMIAGAGSLLVEEGKGEQAVALVDRALTMMPDDDLLLARGFLLERLGRLPEAVADMRAVVARRPDDPVTLNALGYTLVDRSIAIDEGQRLIARALEAKPDSFAIQDSMGWALVRQGRLDEGRIWLERAWGNSEDPEVAAHLGETLWLQGRTGDARRIWDEALADNPDSTPLLRAIERHPR